MAFGFKSINDASTLQIDDTYKNLELKSMTTINTSSLSSQSGNISSGTIVIDSLSPPIIAFKDSQGYTAVTFLYNSGASATVPGGFTYRISVSVYKPSTTHYNITYYIFDNPSSVSQIALPSMGMVTYNSLGAIVYRSDTKYFNIADLIADPSPLSSTGTTTTHTYTTGRTYAVVMCDPILSYATYVDSSTGITYTFTGGFKCSGNTVTTNWAVSTGGTYVAVSIQRNILGLVLDVTNF